MPAPAVIPAPIAYIKVAAVKGFVVEYGVSDDSVHPASIQTLFYDGTDALPRPLFTERPKLFPEDGNVYACDACLGRPPFLL